MYLDEFYERLKRTEGGGKANIALARKFLEIVHWTLRDGWVFDEFFAFRFKDGSIPIWSRDGAKKYAVSRRKFPHKAKAGNKMETI